MKNPIFFKKFASQFDALPSEKNLNGWQILGQSSPNGSGGIKYAKNRKIQRVNHISCRGYLNTLCKG